MLSDSNIERIIEAGSRTADLVEVYLQEMQSRGVGLLNGKANKASSAFIGGVGIRLMSGTNTIYVYSDDEDPDVLLKLTREAATALKSGNPGVIRALQESCVTKAFEKRIDPMSVPKSDMIDIMRQSSDYAFSYNDMISQTQGSLSAVSGFVRICNSHGVNKTEMKNRIRITCSVIATRGDEKQTGSFSPGSCKGYEFINDYPIIDKTRESCDSAIRMACAGYAPSGRMPVILGNGFGGVIFHEACGHALEATSVGIKSSCFCDKLNKQIANPVVNAFDNARIDGEWGSYMTDDEGHESTNLQLIKDGICVNYLVDELGSRRMNMPATGCSRRENFTYAPTSRMSNTYIANGTDTPEQIIADTEYGLYCTKMGGGSVDTSTGEFNFASSEAYIIRNGKICEPVRGATLIGKGQEILMNIDRVANDLELAAGVCGSISGGVPVTVGQPTIRVSSILVGGRDGE